MRVLVGLAWDDAVTDELRDGLIAMVGIAMVCAMISCRFYDRA
jgi:hypothetical protein